jgi:hypothetical protein
MDTITYSILYEKKAEPVLPRRALLEVLDDRSETLQFISAKPYTFVQVRSWYNGHEYSGCGFSKVCYPDKWDAEFGADTAHRRALINIYHQVRHDEYLSELPF